jgi:hypothetical protein
MSDIIQKEKNEEKLIRDIPLVKITGLPSARKNSKFFSNMKPSEIKRLETK